MNTTFGEAPRTVSIGILGTGNISAALGEIWAARGHTVVFGGRSPSAARLLASRIGRKASGGSLEDAVTAAQAVLLAIPWISIDDVLDQIGVASGALSSTTVIDPTNPVEHAVGQHLLCHGSSAEHIASRARNAHVVKAFNVHPASYWQSAHADDVVTLAGDDFAALDLVAGLVRDTGATPYVLGGLARARQIEELAGTVIALGFNGVNPRSALPR
ncbi:NADPH-dependent F420 reductase [Rhodococcus sp. IEGM1428]|uniref:NADPH-dependent F420 reductase n=1 Tax=Rhodococcus sp. IEGM1428 TaxID=3392191 RepID=UPI003D0E8D4E